jgi:hypothetical protein
MSGEMHHKNARCTWGAPKRNGPRQAVPTGAASAPSGQFFENVPELHKMEAPKCAILWHLLELCKERVDSLFDLDRQKSFSPQLSRTLSDCRLPGRILISWETADSQWAVRLQMKFTGLALLLR